MLSVAQEVDLRPTVPSLRDEVRCFSKRLSDVLNTVNAWAASQRRRISIHFVINGGFQLIAADSILFCVELCHLSDELCCLTRNHFIISPMDQLAEHHLFFGSTFRISLGSTIRLSADIHAIWI